MTAREEQSWSEVQEYLQQGAFGYIPPSMNQFGDGEDAERDNFGIYDDDDEGRGEYPNSFDRLETLESEKTMALLLNNDFRIFESRYQYQEEIRKFESTQNQQSRNPMYYSEGYEANVDQADDLELARWQHFFPFVQVVGEGYEVARGLIHRESEDNTYLNSSGSKQPQDEEFFATDTQPLRLLPTIDRELEGKVKKLSTKVWPVVVNNLQPVIVETLKKADENQVPNNMEEFIAFSQSQMEVEEADGKDDFWD